MREQVICDAGVTPWADDLSGQTSPGLQRIRITMPLRRFRTRYSGKSRRRPHRIRYAAKLVGPETDNERAIRWLIALMVLCCDPLAIALTAAAARRAA